MRGEVFIGHDLSELSIFLVAFSIILQAWELWQLPLCAVRRVGGLGSVAELVNLSCQAVSNSLGRDMPLVYKSKDILVK